jgi:hypothetical protein
VTFWRSSVDLINALTPHRRLPSRSHAGAVAELLAAAFWVQAADDSWLIVHHVEHQPDSLGGHVAAPSMVGPPPRLQRRDRHLWGARSLPGL